MTRVSKEKQAKTLKDMKKRREEDSIHVRTIVTQKIDWAKAEYEKGKDYIQKLKKQIEDTEQKILRLEGCISGLQQVLSESTVKPDDKA